MASIDPVAVETAKSQAAQTTDYQVQNSDSDGVSVTNEDDHDLLKLGYRSVLARGWGTFDNFACSFSALNVIGGIRVLFYIALSGGGPAAMYVKPFRYPVFGYRLPGSCSNK
jgi:hypothetical protein